jgi:hypothetical protein
MVIKIPSDYVYKMHDIGSNIIYVFGGMYSEINDIFSDTELERFRINETVIYKSKYYINKTDTISAIKQKLIQNHKLRSIFDYVLSYLRKYFLCVFIWQEEHGHQLPKI